MDMTKQGSKENAEGNRNVGKTGVKYWFDLV